MGAEFSELLPQAVAAGGQGYLQGREQRVQEDQTRQMMALRAAEEGRATEAHPLAMQSRRDVLAREPLQREALEQGLRGGRPAGAPFSEIVRKASGARAVDVSELDRDEAELVYRLESARASAAESARLRAANQERDDELRAWHQNFQRNKEAVDGAEAAVRGEEANLKAFLATQKGLFGEQKKAAEEKTAGQELRVRAAKAVRDRIRQQALSGDEAARRRFKEKYNIDPASIAPETVPAVPSTGGGVLGTYGGN